MKKLVEIFEVNDYLIVVFVGFCVYVIKNYLEYFICFGEFEWVKCVEKVVNCFYDLIVFIVNVLGKINVGVCLIGKVVYYLFCSLMCKLGVVNELLILF